MSMKTVELPTKPTLGWMHGPESTPLFDSWTKEVVTNEGPPPGTYVSGYLTGSFVELGEITAFIPATAVPTSALDEFRWQFSKSGNYLIKDFFAAIDEANA